MIAAIIETHSILELVAMFVGYIFVIHLALLSLCGTSFVEDAFLAVSGLLFRRDNTEIQPPSPPLAASQPATRYILPDVLPGALSPTPLASSKSVATESPRALENKRPCTGLVPRSEPRPVKPLTPPRPRSYAAVSSPLAVVPYTTAERQISLPPRRLELKPSPATKAPPTIIKAPSAEAGRHTSIEPVRATESLSLQKPTAPSTQVGVSPPATSVGAGTATREPAAHPVVTIEKNSSESLRQGESAQAIVVHQPAVQSVVTIEKNSSESLRQIEAALTPGDDWNPLLELNLSDCFQLIDLWLENNQDLTFRLCSDVRGHETASVTAALEIEQVQNVLHVMRKRVRCLLQWVSIDGFWDLSKIDIAGMETLYAQTASTHHAYDLIWHHCGKPDAGYLPGLLTGLVDLKFTIEAVAQQMKQVNDAETPTSMPTQQQPPTISQALAVAPAAPVTTVATTLPPKQPVQEEKKALLTLEYFLKHSSNNVDPGKGWPLLFLKDTHERLCLMKAWVEKSQLEVDGLKVEIGFKDPDGTIKEHSHKESLEYTKSRFEQMKSCLRDFMTGSEVQAESARFFSEHKVEARIREVRAVLQDIGEAAYKEGASEEAQLLVINAQQAVKDAIYDTTPVDFRPAAAPQPVFAPFPSGAPPTVPQPAPAFVPAPLQPMPSQRQQQAPKPTDKPAVLATNWMAQRENPDASARPFEGLNHGKIMELIGRWMYLSNDATKAMHETLKDANRTKQKAAAIDNLVKREAFKKTIDVVYCRFQLLQGHLDRDEQITTEDRESVLIQARAINATVSEAGQIAAGYSDEWTTMQDMIKHVADPDDFGSAAGAQPMPGIGSLPSTTPSRWQAPASTPQSGLMVPPANAFQGPKPAAAPQPQPLPGLGSFPASTPQPLPGLGSLYSGTPSQWQAPTSAIGGSTATAPANFLDALADPRSNQTPFANLTHKESMKLIDSWR